MQKDVKPMKGDFEHVKGGGSDRQDRIRLGAGDKRDRASVGGGVSGAPAKGSDDARQIIAVRE